MTDIVQETAPAEQEPIGAASDISPPPEPEKQTSTIEESLARAFKADLSEKPKEQTEPEGESNDTADAERPRGPDGKFAAKDGDKKETAEPPAEPEGGAKQPEAKEEAPKGFDEAPARFSADAKAAWKDAPKEVRAEAHRMMRELEDGLAQKDQIIEPLKPYMEMAQKHGTTMQDALANYTRIDALLHQSPAEGYRHLARTMGHSPEQVAALLTGQQPGQPDPRDQEIQRLNGEMRQMQQQLAKVNTGLQSQREQAVLEQVNQFATQNPRFNELANDITEMLATGYATSLEDAYQKASRLNPAPPEPEPTPPAPPPAAQTREAKSVTGAPSAGSNPARRPPSKSPEEALRRAFNW